MAGIVGQSDYYGLPEQNRPEPPSEQHLAELLKKAKGTDPNGD